MKAIVSGTLGGTARPTNVRAGRMSLLVAGAAALLAGGVALGLQGLGSDSSPLPVQRVESEISAGLGSDIPSLRPVRPEITAGLTAPASAEIPDAFVRAVNAHTR